MSYLEKYLKYKNKYLSLKEQIAGASKKKNYPARFGRWDKTNFLYIMYMFDDESSNLNWQNKLAIKERQDIVLNGHKPQHNRPHLTLFDFRWHSDHGSLIMKNGGANYKQFLIEVIKIIAGSCNDSVFEHESNKFDIYQSFFVKKYFTKTYPIAPFLNNVLKKFSEIYGVELTKVNPTDPTDKYYYYFNSNHVKSSGVPKPHTLPLLAIPYHQYEFATGKVQEGHVSLFNLQDIKPETNNSLYNRIEKVKKSLLGSAAAVTQEDINQAILQTILQYQTDRMNNGYLINRGAFRFTKNGKPLKDSSGNKISRKGVLPFNNVKCNLGLFVASRKYKNNKDDYVKVILK